MTNQSERKSTIAPKKEPPPLDRGESPLTA